MDWIRWGAIAVAALVVSSHGLDLQLRIAVRELNSAIAMAKELRHPSGRGEYGQGAALRALKKLQSHLPD